MSSIQRVLPDPFEFARTGAELKGEVDAGVFERLADILRPDENGHKVSYTLTGSREDDKSFLHLQAEGALTLGCQRCLENLRCDVTVDSRLLLVPNGAQMPDDELQDDDFDPIHAGHDFDVLAALEEELLLALPLAPTHSQCDLPGSERNIGGKESPFAVLGRLKQGGNS